MLSAQGDIIGRGGDRENSKRWDREVSSNRIMQWEAQNNLTHKIGKFRFLFSKIIWTAVWTNDWMRSMLSGGVS